MLLPIIMIIIFSGCSQYPENPPLKSISEAAGYRYRVVRPAPTKDKPFVILSFSGGGKRAAALSFGLMEELRLVEYTTKGGSKRRLLDDVEIISSVSGGSFTSAYYVLFPDRFFSDFPDRFLFRNIHRELMLRLLNPYNWFRFASSNFSRSDMADEYYNDTIFEKQTFANLLNKPKGTVPFLLINATDMTTLQRFTFTQDQFDLLCSDLSGVSVSRAVTASSNFPVVFNPLTIKIYKQTCGAYPLWEMLNNGNMKSSMRTAEAMAALSYRDSDRLYAHLLDGGLSDNLGLRVTIDAVTTTDSPLSVLRYANMGGVGSIMLIAVNAKTTRKRTWDASSSPPGILSVLNMITDGPVDTVTSDSVMMFDEQLDKQKQIELALDSFRKSIAASCSYAPRMEGMTMPDITFAELAFDGIPDSRLRRCLQEIPTSLSLPKKSINLLRAVGGYLLMNSNEFIAGMKRLDPSWQPRNVVIDKKLIADACGAI